MYVVYNGMCCVACFMLHACVVLHVLCIMRDMCCVTCVMRHALCDLCMWHVKSHTGNKAGSDRKSVQSCFTHNHSPIFVVDEYASHDT